MSNLQQKQPDPDYERSPYPVVKSLSPPCEWCGGTGGHFGWCDNEQLKALHAKIDHLTTEIEAITQYLEVLRLNKP